jgi:hypothetical protein
MGSNTLTGWRLLYQVNAKAKVMKNTRKDVSLITR